MARMYIFKRFERLWHWSQALLIIAMLLTGFEVHGTYQLLGWQQAGAWHVNAAWALLILWAFAIFWHFTTGEWKQYIPTTEKIVAVARYYAFGIFSGDEHHPFQPTPLLKHNPLQRMAYLFVKLVISPMVWITGLLYLYFRDIGTRVLNDKWVFHLDSIAVWHTLAAFLMLIFLIVHVYFATTGHTPLAHIKAMITGWDDVQPENH